MNDDASSSQRNVVPPDGPGAGPDDRASGRNRPLLPPRDEDWYRTLVEAVEDAIFVLDREWRIAYANDAAARSFRKSAGQLVSQRLQELFPTLEGSPLMAALEQVMTTRTRARVTHEFPLDEPSGLWFENHLFPVPEGVLAVGIDITERKRIEDALRRGEERYRRLFEQSLDAIYIVTPDGKNIECNQAWLDLLGYSHEELDALDAIDIYADPADRADFLTRIAESGRLEDEVRLKRKDGSVISCDRRVVALKDDSGRVIAFQGVHRDITARNEAQKALRESERRFRGLFDDSMDAIVIATTDGVILEANQACLDMFQYSRDDLKSLNAVDLYADPARREALLRRVAENSSLISEVKYRRKDGSVFDGRVKVTTLYDDAGRVELYQGIIYDITELTQAEERERDQRLFAGALMETSPACILVFDIERRIVFANAEADRVLGIPHEQLMGMICGEEFRLFASNGSRLDEEELPGCLVFRTEAPMYAVEYAFDSPTGRRILSISAAPLHDDTGTVTRVVTTVEDVTAAKHRELSLHESEARYRSLFDRSLDMVVLTDLQGRVVDANPATIAALGYSRDELVGRPIMTHLSAEDRHVVVDMLATVLGTGSLPHLVEFTARRKDGAELQVEVNASLVSREAQTAGIEIVARDVSERKRRELEREESLVRLRNAMNATVSAMSAAVEMRDPYTAGHQARVTTVAQAIAGEMGLTDSSLQALEVAGRVHDLGKLRIPSEILTKPGKLSDVEYQLIKEHPQASYDLLKGIDFPWPVAQIAYQHHERVNGSGYPRGLKGDAMLPESRILAVADVFEAMSSHRPYRPALGKTAAMEEIRAHSGTLYDPLVVDALNRLVYEKGFKLE